ncbi:hypothetical protein IJJ27_02525 [bacterium]|nr:hypothetical protein [bacterium]
MNLQVAARQLLRFLRSHFALVILVCLWAIIIGTNFLSPRTWLLGYDHLSPELNFALSLDRIRYSVFQSYRGLGVVSSVMDGAELTRMPWVWLATLIFSARLVRFSWVAAMILLGGISSYYLFHKLLSLTFLSKRRFGTVLQCAALTGSIFYLANPAMVQFFYSPLETFTSFYGFLPLILLVFIAFLRDNRWQNLLWLLVLSFLSSSAFYVQTFFVVLILCLGVLGLGFLPRRLLKPYLARFFLGIAAVIIANGFWFLPALVTNLQHSNDVFTSKQNLISTPQVQEMNYYFGDLDDIATFTSYWTTYTEYNADTDQYSPYLGAWQDYWQNPGIHFLSWGLFLIAISGFVFSWYSSKNRLLVFASSLFFLLSIFMLTAGHGLLGLPFRLASNISLFAQMFRVSFTKWSIVLSLALGLGLGHFMANLGLFCRRRLEKPYFRLIFTTSGALLSLASLTSVALIFAGHLFGWHVQVELPEEYFALQQFMLTQDHDGLTAYLPMPNFWGWLYYDWNYRGSGFLWQMLPQPILDRNFDVWSLYNQTAYQQLHLSIERHDVALFQQVIHKYGIRYLILDQKIINSNVSRQLVQLRANSEIESLLRQSGVNVIYQSQDIKVYDTGLLTDTQTLTLLPSYQTVKNATVTATKDVIFAQEGHYLHHQQGHVFYPFVHGLDENIAGLDCNAQTCTLSQEPLADSSEQKTIVIPGFTPGETITVTGEALFADAYTLKLRFKTGLELLVDNRAYALPELEDLTLTDLTLTTSRAILDFGDQKPHLVEQGRATRFSVQLVVGEPLTVNVIDATHITDLTASLRVAPDQVQTYNFTASIWEPLTTESQLSVTTASPLKVRWSTTSQTLDLSQPISQRELNCDVSGRGQVSKTVSATQSLYQSDNFATACESFALDDLSTLNNYILQVAATNLSGHPLAFFVDNATTRKTLIDQVLSSDETTQYFYVPQLQTFYNQHSQLAFHLTNKSYGLSSQNAVRQIRFIEYPIEYLSRIKVLDYSRPLATNPSDLTLTATTTYNQAAYGLTLSGRPSFSQPALIRLAKSFDAHWLAWGKTAHGWQRLDHVIVDSWANGWLLPTDTPVTQVYLFFWPQALTWLGAGAFIATLLGVVAYGYYRRRQPRRLTCNRILGC